MSEEEDEAMWYFGEVLVDLNDIKQWKIVENLINKLQKENEELKNYEYIKALLQQADDLKDRIKELQKEKKELKGALERDIYARDCLVQQSISKNKIKEIIESSSYPDFAIQKIIELLEEK